MRPLKSRSIRFPCGMPLCKRRMMQKSRGESGINTRLLIRVTNSEACITTSQCTGMSCLKLAEFLRTRRCSQDFDCPTSTGRDSVRMEHELTHAEQFGLHLKTREKRWAVMNTWKNLTVPQPLSRILRFRRTYLICIVRNSSSYGINAQHPGIEQFTARLPSLLSPSANAAMLLQAFTAPHK